MEAQSSTVTTAVLNALSNDGRRRILGVIAERGGEMTSGEIAEQFSTAWSTTTRHLAVLREAGLVSVRKRGREPCPIAPIRRSVNRRSDWLAPT